MIEHGPYACLLVDSPWPEKGGCGRGTGSKYPTVRVEEMPRLILSSPAWQPATDAHVWMWVTNTHLLAGGWLLGTLGARYVTCFTWVKPRVGMGQYARQRTEHILLGVIGDGLGLRFEHNDNRSIDNVIEEAFRLHRFDHSEKPVESYEKIEAISPGPRVELFAREERAGWDRWGLDAPPGPGLIAGATRRPDVAAAAAGGAV